MDLHGIAAEILGPPEKEREGEPETGGVDVGFVTAAGEFRAALRDPDATDADIARKLWTMFEMYEASPHQEG